MRLHHRTTGTLLRYAVLILSLCCGAIQAQTNEHHTTTKYDRDHPEEAARLARLVYVCYSHGEYRYHVSERCREYKSCKHTESRIDIDEAKRQKFKPCAICVK